ncbi:hypothetical protein Hanom_Chr17g01533671 [Helianthus anomalus]
MPEGGEMEEGEIRCNMPNPDNSGGRNAVRAVAEGVDTSEVGGVANQQSQNSSPAGSDHVHGDNERSPRVLESNGVGNRDEAARGSNNSGVHMGYDDGNILRHNGPINVDNIHSQSGPVNTPGPNAPPSLGKRSHDQRSPPSVGSTQGPHIRLRQDGDGPEERSLDLNRSTEHQTYVEELFSGSLQHNSSNLAQRHSSVNDPGVTNSALEVQINVEIDATTGVGDAVGINLHGFETETRGVINGEGDFNGLQ